MRKKLIGIMSTYDLLEVIDINEAEKPENHEKHKPYEGKVKNEKHINKGLFKDKKLNKLWERAETGGFSPEELAALKEEFTHHEEKIQLYYSMLEKLTNVKDDRDNEKHLSKLIAISHSRCLISFRSILGYFVCFTHFSVFSSHNLDAIDEENHDSFNEIFSPNEDTNEVKQIEKPEEKHRKYEAKVNDVRDKHREIRDNTDRLERKVAEKSDESDFIEPKVQGLWKIAQAGIFTADELASIKVELHHFESRFLKLRTMHAEHALARERNKDLKPGDKHHDRLDELEGKIKKHSRKVEKLQDDLEKRLQKHNEL